MEKINTEISNLSNTINNMLSDNYLDRLIAEGEQLSYRYNELSKMLADWDAGVLPFSPKSPRTLYEEQLKIMEKYLIIIEYRIKYELTYDKDNK